LRFPHRGAMSAQPVPPAPHGIGAIDDEPPHWADTSGRRSIARFLYNVPVSDVMTRPVVSIQPDASLFDALVLLRTNQVSGLPVVDDVGCPVGVLSERDPARVLTHSSVSPPIQSLLDALMVGLLDLHLVLDNLSTHKTPEVKRWVLRHPRFHFHFVPTGSSWLNRVERWFNDLTYRQIRRGTFRSERELIEMLKLYIERYSEVPRPFQWRATADEIPVKVTRNRLSLGLAGTAH
jgi:transposase